MKLATYKDGSRDGQLVVVSRDLSLAHYATGIASRLQQVLDDWNFLAPQLQDLYDTLNQGNTVKDVVVEGTNQPRGIGACGTSGAGACCLLHRPPDVSGRQR